MSQKKIPRVAFRAFTRPTPTPHKPRFALQTPRKPPAHDPNLVPRVFTPSTPVRTDNAYPGRPRASLQLDQPGTIASPYFPRGTVFVFNPPKEPFVPYKEREADQKRREAEQKKREAEKKLAAPEGYVENQRPMTSHIDILATPTADTPGGCLYVHFDKKRYLFGRVGEGTQRAMNQRKCGLSTLEHIFISGEVNWATVGGMMGFILTVADVIVGSREAHAEMNRARAAKGQKEKAKSSENVERLDIHGAENLTYSLATSRNFLFRTGMPFKTCELAADPRLADPKDSKPDFEDECLRVWKVPIYKQGPSRKRRREGEDEADETDVDSPTRKKRKSDEQRALGVLVESMFNSDWRMDALVPTKLLDVNLPAAIFIRGKDNSIERYKGPFPDSGKDVPNIDVLVREPWPATKIHTLPQTQPSAQAMCYIAKNHPRRGRFMALEAKALGVDPRDNKKLVAGESVPGKDGTTVTPDMVVEPQQKCQGFVVADIADVSYIGTFMSRPEWSNEEVMDGIAVIYWILGQGVVSHPDIQSFMRARPGMKHVVMAPDTCPNMIAFESHAALTAKLQRIDPDRFPTPKFSNLVPDLGIADAPFIAGRTGKRIRTMPSLQVMDQMIVPFCNTELAASELDEEIVKLAAAAAEKASDPKFLEWIEDNEKDIPNRDAEITPLGTGSAVPSKYRNVSSTLIRVPGSGSYLLDCGENTLGQIRRAYGFDGAAEIMSELRMVFISHMHADHHLGMMGVLDAWQKASPPTSTLSISCPAAMRSFIEEYGQVQPVDFSRIRFYGDTHSDTNYDHTFPEGDPSGLKEISRVRVEHCKAAHAGVLTWPSGLKVAYSGDCRPNHAFAKKAAGATLLVHEATFEDEKGADARAKKHSTMAEALGIAERMGARRVLLTHFSQRYAKVPTREGLEGGKEGDEGEGEEPEPEERVVLNAFDLMRVKLGEFRRAEVFLPAVRKLLEEETK